MQVYESYPGSGAPPCVVTVQQSCCPKALSESDS